jgi:phosphatidylinositol alpha-mannosyltransferase
VATVHTAQARALAMRAGAATVARRSRRIDAHIAVSAVAAHTLARYSDAPVEVIPNALDVDRFAGGRACGGNPVVLFLGRVDEPRKGLSVALRAMRQVVADVPGARLVVAGPGSVPAGLDAHVDVLGPVGETAKAALLRSADVVLAPHLGGESFGIVVAEAMAAGAPVVASDLPAFRALLGDGRHGVLVPPGRAGDLAAAVTGLLADPARRTSLGRSGRTAARHLDWSVVTPRIVEVYARTLAGR